MTNLKIGDKVVKAITHNTVSHYGEVIAIKENKIQVRWYANQGGWENINIKTWVKPEILKLNDGLIQTYK